MGDQRDPGTDLNPDRVQWPLPQLDTSPSATRRRGMRLFHVVLLVMGGGAGALWLGPWVIAAAIVYVGVLAVRWRGQNPDPAASVERMSTQLTDLYSRLEQANKQIADAKEKRPPNAQEDPGVDSPRTLNDRL